MRPIIEIIIHCSATIEGKDFNAEDIDRWHRQRGWSGIGYHYVIPLNGAIEFGRPLDKIGAHCKGRNQGSIGICYIGGVDEAMNAKDTRTPQQKESLKQLVDSLKTTFGSDIKVFGHNQFSRKACPSFDVGAEFPND